VLEPKIRNPNVQLIPKTKNKVKENAKFFPDIIPCDCKIAKAKINLTRCKKLAKATRIPEFPRTKFHTKNK